jgi:hypothetical protein
MWKELTAVEARELTKNSWRDTPAHLLVPIYEEIERAARMGRRFIEICCANCDEKDYLLVIYKLRQNGYGVTPKGQESGVNIVSW